MGSCIEMVQNYEQCMESYLQDYKGFPDLVDNASSYTASFSEKASKIVKNCLNCPMEQPGESTEFLKFRTDRINMLIGKAFRAELYDKKFRELPITVQHRILQNIRNRIVPLNEVIDDSIGMSSLLINGGVGLPLSFMVPLVAEGAVISALGAIGLYGLALTVWGGVVIMGTIMVPQMIHNHQEWEDIESRKEMAKNEIAELGPRPFCYWEVQGQQTVYVTRWVDPPFTISKDAN